MVVTGHWTPDTGDHQPLTAPGLIMSHNVHKQCLFSEDKEKDYLFIEEVEDSFVIKGG